MSFAAIERRIELLENHHGPTKLVWLELGDAPPSEDQNAIYLQWDRE